MNDIELNAILYYADYLSMKQRSIPVTDTCNYFFVFDVPINSTFLADTYPDFDEQDQFFQQAMQEYQLIKDKFGEEGVMSFVDRICNLKSAGHVNAETMLQCIHQYSSKQVRKDAFNRYYAWKRNKKYKHIIMDENGDPVEEECTKYVVHSERNTKKRQIFKELEEDKRRSSKNS